MSDDWEARWAARKTLVQPMIDEAIFYLKKAVADRNRVSEGGYVDLCSMGVMIRYAHGNLEGVRGMTGSVSSLGTGIEDTGNALKALEKVVMSMWPSQDIEIQRAVVTIFDRIAPNEIKNLSEDPHGELRYAAMCRAAEDRAAEEKKP